jgi:phosphoacetylglucosamine mutase
MVFVSVEAASKYPKPAAKLGYGTAGFRTKAELLDSTFYRMGMLAVLRSRAKGGLAVGLMVTASHNPEPDNGIKLVDSDGGMLAQSWEAYATAVANAPEAELSAELAKVVASEGIGDSTKGLVLLGQDTRSHSARLSSLALEGVAVVSGVAKDCGLLTTPQLHHLVRLGNGAGQALIGPAEWNSEAGYYSMLWEAYAQLTSDAATKERGPLWVDCAFGIGAPQIETMAARMGGALELRVANKPGEGELNLGCGAEHVQKGRVPPAGYEAPLADCRRACSVDGDADRIVFHYYTQQGAWKLLDGDKIAALCASFVRDELAVLGGLEGLTTAVVQTAYANGAASSYMRSLGLQLPMAKTGVKFLHHEALNYDIAVYFEANGHGTLIFSDKATRALLDAKKQAEEAKDTAKVKAASRLLAARQLINQAVGDAISDMLFVEAVLAMRGWQLEDWDGLYTDLPSRQTKLPVMDRAVVECTADETRTTAPASLQPALDALMKRFPQGRCFVRPSGTEDVVRVYAEAETQAQADELALLTAQAAHEHAGGKGPKPTTMVA